MRILFIVPYPTEGPSNRYRVEQYLPYLKDKGIECDLRPFVSSDFFKIISKKGNLAKKTPYFLSYAGKRLLDLINSRHYDLIFVHIESFPFGPAIFEWFFRNIGKPIIFDFEDAIYLKNFKGNNQIFNFLKCPNKFFQILRLSSHVIVCNKYMKEFVSRYNQNVTIIPTAIDTSIFKVKENMTNKQIPVIGWVGSHSTYHYLTKIFPAFLKLRKKHDFILKIIGAGRNTFISGVNVVNENWSLKKEVENFQSLDIGVYPLPDDEQSRAKTPFKTIQYMSVGIPVIAKAVGGNKDIIQDGINGFLVSSENEWVDKLSLLIENQELWRKFGREGRRTVEEKYSLKVNAPKFLKIIQNI